MRVHRAQGRSGWFAIHLKRNLQGNCRERPIQRATRLALPQWRAGHAGL